MNALGPQAIAPLLEALRSGAADPAVRAIVLAGARGTFSGGADMKTFGVTPPPRPYTRDLIEALEASEKPVVAAIEGVAMGGGLEVALACDARVAAPGARLALPEISRGLLPGAGGTQRLPRLIGVAPALAMIVTGEPVDAARAAELGLVDRVAAGDAVDDAVALARTLAGAPRRRASSLQAVPDPDAIAAARRRAQPEARGGLAEHRAIDCVEDAVALPFAEGLVRERERFVELVGSEQSKARIHVFFAEREAAKPPAGTAAPAPVKTAAVIGGGTMGTGIAMACANAGVQVTLVDLQPELLERARGIIAGNYGATMRKGKLSQADHDARIARIGFATSLDAAADVDLVIEAVFEEMDVKQEVFRAIDRIARPGALLATNTSTLDIDAIARDRAAAGRRRDAFLQPGQRDEAARDRAGSAHVRRDDRARARRREAAREGRRRRWQLRRLHRQPHAVRVHAAGGVLLEEGAPPQRIDKVIKDFGFPMGPFAMGDLAGLDVGWRIRKRRHAEYPPEGRYSKVADRLCEIGRFGQKTGAGYYRYESGERTPIPTRRSTRSCARARRKRASRSARSATTRSSSGACTRWSTRRRRSSTKASRRVRATSTSCGCTATASRPSAAGRCGGPIGRAALDRRRSRRVRARARRHPRARAAAAQARGLRRRRSAR